MIFNFIYPLDLQTLFVNTFSGNILIFGFLAMIVIAGLTAYFRMPNSISLIMFGIFLIIFAPFVEGLWILALLFAAIFAAYNLRRIITR